MESGVEGAEPRAGLGRRSISSQVSSLLLSAGFGGDPFASRPCHQTRNAGSQHPNPRLAAAQVRMPRPGAAGPEANWQAGFGAPLPAAPGTPSPASWGGIGLPRASALCLRYTASCQAEFMVARGVCAALEDITCSFVEEERQQTAKTSACLRYRGRNPQSAPSL